MTLVPTEFETGSASIRRMGKILIADPAPATVSIAHGLCSVIRQRRPVHLAPVRPCALGTVYPNLVAMLKSQVSK